MKFLRISAMVFLGASLVPIAICIFTDRNDDLFLPMGLTVSAVGQILNMLYNRRAKRERANVK